MHISTVNCFEMVGDKLMQPAYEIFAIKYWLQQSKSRPLRSRMSAQAGVK